LAEVSMNAMPRESANSCEKIEYTRSERETEWNKMCGLGYLGLIVRHSSLGGQIGLVADKKLVHVLGGVSKFRKKVRKNSAIREK